MSSQPLRRTTSQRTVEPQPDPVLGRALEQRDARSAKLLDIWALSPEERVQALYDGKLTFRQCFDWAARAPHEVPRVNGEFIFIACRTPEWLEG
jgi:hypothetical protein